MGDAMNGGKADKGKLFPLLFNASQESDEKVGNLSGYNFLAGEPLADTYNGAPMVFSLQDGKMNIANFMQMQIYSAIASLALGMDILKEEKVKVDLVYGHGGYFKTPMIGQKAVSALVNAPAVVMDNAGEGGAWGIALLASYMVNGEGMTLEDYLDKEVFADSEGITIAPDPDEVQGFESYIEKYVKLIPSESAAAEVQ